MELSPGMWSSYKDDRESGNALSLSIGLINKDDRAQASVGTSLSVDL
jgi:hypothetical protein